MATAADDRAVLELRTALGALARRFQMQLEVHDENETPKVLILVSRLGHCLNDLLYRRSTGGLRAEVVGGGSNHLDLAALTRSYEVEYHHLPVSAENRSEQERQIVKLVQELGVELVILARYMQILSPEMVEALERVKAKFKTGCITNNLPANSIGSLGGRSLYVAEVMALFDHVIESAKIGLRKPDPRIYQMMVESLDVDPKKCVYLDDLGVNLKPARAMGMTTIKVLNTSQVIDELEAATGLSLR